MDIIREIDEALAANDATIIDDTAVSDDAMRFIPSEAPAAADLRYGELIADRAEAIASGAQVEVPAELVQEAGFAVSMTMTRAAWDDCVAWGDEDTDRTGAYQDESGRLWDVLYLAVRAFRRYRAAETQGRARPIPFQLYRVARDARSGEDGDIEPTPVVLHLVLGEDPEGNGLLLIRQPSESR